MKEREKRKSLDVEIHTYTYLALLDWNETKRFEQQHTYIIINTCMYISYSSTFLYHSCMNWYTICMCVLYVQQYESYHPPSLRTVLLAADGHGSRAFVFQPMVLLGTFPPSFNSVSD
jgi:hypothetical protein